MAVWWVTEALPIPVTSLVPLALLPLFGIASLKTVAPNYAKPIAFLFLGGFMLALALEQSGLHRRFARAIMSIVGSRPRRLLLGFMIASGSLSMWISNTASVMVMLPIGLSVLHAASDRLEGSERLRFSTAVMLGIAYAANIGGMATPVGTPPNLVFLEVSRQAFPAAPEFSFAQWMSIGLPTAVLFIGVAWSLLAFVVFRLPNEPLFDEDPAPLGPVSRDEWASGLIFAAAALLWVTGSDLQVGGAKLTGWRSSLNLPQATDGVVAIACALLLFVVPSAERSGETLLKWETTQHKLPWSLLLLFGGGFALAAGFKSTGLSSGVAHCWWIQGRAGLAAGGRGLLRLDLPHRADLQHRDHHAGAPRPGRRRPSLGGAPLGADDPRHPVGLLRLHDAGQLTDPGHRLRHGAHPHQRDGARRHLAQPRRRLGRVGPVQPLR